MTMTIKPYIITIMIMTMRNTMNRRTTMTGHYNDDDNDDVDENEHDNDKK
jgi:hypothetical protein